MRRVAVVEDNPDNRLLARAILEAHYEVQEYETGQDALAAMPADPPDLILLDISLPGMDGPEVLQRLKEFEVLRNVPVVALTAHAMVGDREAYLAAGFDEYVTKPIVDERDLLDVVARLL